MSVKFSPHEMANVASRSHRLVKVLAENFPSRSGLNPDILSATADFIEKEFRSLGFQVESQVFGEQSAPLRNLIIEQKGLDEKQPCIIIGAHYDTVLGTPGADDNASGVAGLLEIARLLKNYHNRRTIRFVAFTHEEPPYFYTRLMGSRKYAKRLKLEREKVRLMICLEMIGYARENAKQSYPFLFLRQLGGYPKYGNFIGIAGNLRTMRMLKIVREAMRQECSIGVESLTAPGFLPPLYLSDQSSFWRYGFPAVMITDSAFLRNPNYHSPTDTDDTLNYDFLAEVVQGVYAAVHALDRLP